MAELSLGWKLWADISQFTSSMKKAKEDAESSNNKITGSFRKLSGKLGEARRDYLDLAAALGPHNKAVMEAKAKLEQLEKQYASIKSSTGKTQTAWEDLKGTFGAVSGAMAGLWGVWEVGKQVIASSDALTDKWEETTTGLEFAWTRTLQAIANGDWSGMLRDIVDATEAGKKYAAVLDEIMERQASLNITEAKTRNEILDLQKVMKDQTKDTQTRANAGAKVMELERKIMAENTALTKTALKNELDKYEIQTKLGAATIQKYVTERNQNNERVKSAEKYLDLLKREQQLKNQIGGKGGYDVGAAENLIRVQKELAAVPNDIAQYATQVVQKIQTSGDLIDNVSAALVAVENAQADFKEGTKRTWSTYTGFLAELNKGTEATKKNAAAVKQLADALMDLDQMRWSGWGGNKQLSTPTPKAAPQNITEDMDMAGATGPTFGSYAQIKQTGEKITKDKIISDTKQVISEVGSILQGGLSPVFTRVFSAIGNAVIQFKEGFKENLKGIISAVADLANSVLSAIGAMVNDSYDNKMAKLDEWYNKEKAAIEGSTQNEAQKRSKIAKLDAEADKKRRELQYKQAKANKEIAIIQAVIAGALGIVNSLAQGGIMGIVMAAIVGALAAIQIGIIASQPLPALAQGGLAYAPTMAMVGDNPNAGADPEVIAPLSKLRDYMGGGGDAQLQAVVRGEDIYFMLERTGKRIDRWR